MKINPTDVKSLGLHEEMLLLIDELNNCKVRYLIFGGRVASLYLDEGGQSDLDIWITKETPNLALLSQAMQALGTRTTTSSLESQFNHDDPLVIASHFTHLHTEATGLNFAEARNRAVTLEMNGIFFPIISKQDLISNYSQMPAPEYQERLQKLRG